LLGHARFGDLEALHVRVRANDPEHPFRPLERAVVPPRDDDLARLPDERGDPLIIERPHRICDLAKPPRIRRTKPIRIGDIERIEPPALRKVDAAGHRRIELLRICGRGIQHDEKTAPPRLRDPFAPEGIAIDSAGGENRTHPRRPKKTHDKSLGGTISARKSAATSSIDERLTSERSHTYCRNASSIRPALKRSTKSVHMPRIFLWVTRLGMKPHVTMNWRPWVLSTHTTCQKLASEMQTLKPGSCLRIDVSPILSGRLAPKKISSDVKPSRRSASWVDHASRIASGTSAVCQRRLIFELMSSALPFWRVRGGLRQSWRVDRGARGGTRRAPRACLRIWRSS